MKSLISKQHRWTNAEPDECLCKPNKTTHNTVVDTWQTLELEFSDNPVLCFHWRKTCGTGCSSLKPTDTKLTTIWYLLLLRLLKKAKLNATVKNVILYFCVLCTTQFNQPTLFLCQMLVTYWTQHNGLMCLLFHLWLVPTHFWDMMCFKMMGWKIYSFSKVISSSDEIPLQRKNRFPIIR